jgi:hypothetical protein
MHGDAKWRETPVVRSRKLLRLSVQYSVTRYTIQCDPLSYTVPSGTPSQVTIKLAVLISRGIQWTSLATQYGLSRLPTVPSASGITTKHEASACVDLCFNLAEHVTSVTHVRGQKGCASPFASLLLCVVHSHVYSRLSAANIIILLCEKITKEERKGVLCYMQNCH